MEATIALQIWNCRADSPFAKVHPSLRTIENHMEKVQYYTRTAQWLHWIMAVIFIAAWLIGFYSGNFLSYEVDGSFKGDVITLHKNIATTIIFLLVVRIFWRYTHPAPDLPNTMSPRMKTLAHAGHLALYFILIALPVTGCLYSWSLGYTAPVLYLFNLPALISENPTVTAHVIPLQFRYYWSVGLCLFSDIAAALHHRFIDRDHVLNSMTRHSKCSKQYSVKPHYQLS